MLNAFVHRIREFTPNRSTLRCSGFTFKCVEEFFVHLNKIEGSNQLKVLLNSY